MAVVLKTTAPSRDIYEQLVAIAGSDAPPGCPQVEVEGQPRELTDTFRIERG